jgi:hypothetical protein
MPARILIYNPASRARSGHVAVRWHDFPQQSGARHLKKGFVLLDQEHREIAYQIEVVDPADPAEKCMVLGLPNWVPPGPQDGSKPSMALTMSDGRTGFGRTTFATLNSKSGTARGVQLSNGYLTTYMSFSRLHDDGRDDCPDRPWYAGAATTVQLGQYEVLDPSGDFLGHDRDKRCMQIDYLYLPSRSDSPEFDLKVKLFDQDYEYVAHADGPVRASVTMKSVSFEHIDVDAATGDERIVRLRLYRVISLYADADYLVEDLSIKHDANDDRELGKVRLPPFIARYYSHMTLGHTPDLFQFADITGWFAVAASWAGRKPGYGFGTTSRTSPVAYPHRDTSVLYDAEVHEKEFSWLLFPCTRAMNVHMFMHRDGRDFDDETGRRWYDMIYHGFRARVSS